MKNAPTGKEELVKLFHQADLLEQVINQLNKDCYTVSEYSWDENSKKPYETLVGKLAIDLKELDHKGHADLLNLLYRIDLSQTVYVNCMDSDQPYPLLAKKILDRELQKVLFRIHYSQ